MNRAVVIGDPGSARAGIAETLAATPGISLLGTLSGRRPIAASMARLRPAVTVLLEPVSSPLPPALIREARSAAPRAVLIVLSADATPGWVAEALNAGATTVLPATVDARALGRVVTEIVAEHDTAYEALRLGWAA
jgi:DNA-binding NarL/FixJ family response regulator